MSDQRTVREYASSLDESQEQVFDSVIKNLFL